MIYWSRWNKMKVTVFCSLIGLLIPCIICDKWERYKSCRWNVVENGCPMYIDSNWECLKYVASCEGELEYHCVRLARDRSIFTDGCALPQMCEKGKEPIATEINGNSIADLYLRCDWCSDPEFINPREKWSATYPKCLVEKNDCDSRHGFECEPEDKTDKHKQARLCACDYSNNFTFGKALDFKILNGEFCTSDKFHVSECINAGPCDEGQERLANYTCVDKCKNGYREPGSFECKPEYRPATGETTINKEDASPSLSTDNQTAETTPSPRTAPPTSTQTTAKTPPSSEILSSQTPSSKPEDDPSVQNDNWRTIAILLACGIGICFVIFVIIIVCVCRRFKKKQSTPRRRRRNTSQDGATSNEIIPLSNNVQNGHTSSQHSNEQYVARNGRNSFPRTVNFKVTITVTNQEYTDEMERVGSDVYRLPITDQLETAMTRALSSYAGVKDVLVKEFRQGSLIVIFAIMTEGLSAPLKDLIKEKTGTGSIGPFSVSKEFKFEKYSDAAPLTRKPSVTEVTETTPSYLEKRGRTKLRRANSEPYRALCQGSIPLAPFEESFLDYPDLRRNVKEAQETLRTASTNDSPFSDVLPQVHTDDIPETVVKADVHTDIDIPSSHSDLGLTEEESNLVAKKALDHLHVNMIRNLQPDAILDKFVMSGFLDGVKIRNIREQKTTTEKNRMIILNVKAKGFQGYQQFKKIIREIQIGPDIMDTHYRRIAEDVKAHPEKYFKKEESSEDISEEHA